MISLSLLAGRTVQVFTISEEESTCPHVTCNSTNYFNTTIIASLRGYQFSWTPLDAFVRNYKYKYFLHSGLQVTSMRFIILHIYCTITTTTTKWRVELTHSSLETFYGTSTNSAEPDQTPHNA